MRNIALVVSLLLIAPVGADEPDYATVIERCRAATAAEALAQLPDLKRLWLAEEIPDRAYFDGLMTIFERGDAETVWPSKFREDVARAVELGADQVRTRYFQAVLSSLTVEVNDEVPSGDSVPVAVVSSVVTMDFFVVQLKSVGTNEVPLREQATLLGLMGPLKELQVSRAVQVPVGPSTTRLDLVVECLWDSATDKVNKQVKAYRGTKKITVPLTVRGPIERAAKRDAAIDAQVVNSCYVLGLAQAASLGGRDLKQQYLQLGFLVGPKVPVPVSFQVYIRGPHGWRLQLGEVQAERGETLSIARLAHLANLSERFDVGQELDVLLYPDPDAARDSRTFESIWPGALLYTDLELGAENTFKVGSGRPEILELDEAEELLVGTRWFEPADFSR